MGRFRPIYLRFSSWFFVHCARLKAIEFVCSPRLTFIVKSVCVFFGSLELIGNTNVKMLNHQTLKSIRSPLKVCMLSSVLPKGNIRQPVSKYQQRFRHNYVRLQYTKTNKVRPAVHAWLSILITSADWTAESILMSLIMSPPEHYVYNQNTRCLSCSAVG